VSKYDSLENNTSIVSHPGLTGQQKVAHLTYLMAQGAELSTNDVASMYCMSWSGAYSMLERISLSLPLTKDETYNGKWYLISDPV